MKDLTPKAQIYIWAMLIAGSALMAWQLGQLDSAPIWLLLVSTAFAALAKILKVEGATARSSHNVSLAIFGFLLVLLGLPSTLFALLVVYLIEWVRYKYKWYIQLFNIAAYAVSFSLAIFLYRAIDSISWDPQLIDMLAVVAAIVASTFINHVLVGFVIWLARGENFAKSGVLSHMTLTIDATLFGMGAIAALLWRINPWACLLVIVPIYVLYTTLKLPSLQRQANTDPKTGLFNTRYFNEALERELARAERNDRPLAIILADLDLLRNINNTYGHLAGDAVLIRVAQILQHGVRDDDVVARFGGEEFAILMPETTSQKAFQRIESIRTLIATTAFEIPTHVHPIKATMSFGVAGRQHGSLTAKEIIHTADLAVYQAKLNGRNRIYMLADEQQGILQDLMLGDAASQPMLIKNVTPLDASSVPPPLTSAAQSETPLDLPPASSPTVRRGAQRRFNGYVAVLSLIALTVSIAVVRPVSDMDWFGVLVFAATVALTEGLALELYVKDTAVSTSAAPLIAGTLLFGPVGALALSLTLASVAWVKNRSSLGRFLVNLSIHVIAGMSILGASSSLSSSVSAESLPSQLLISVLAATILYLCSTALVALAVNIDTGESVRLVWMQRFWWLAPYFIALGVLAAILIFIYLKANFAGVLMVLVPMFMLRFGQKQYIDRTKGMVKQVRAINAELLRHTQEISKLNEELTLALAQAIDLRDPYVLGHSQQVARYAVLIATEMGLSPNRIELIHKAALLHDIGKLGISEHLLFKPSRLTMDEYEIMKQHATLGADIVITCHSLQALVPIIRHHHERYDGSGYPQHLQAEAIPLEARIIALADAIEAMSSDRPYRTSMHTQAILDEVKAHAGTQFDPHVVAAFNAVVQRDGESVIVNSARTTSARNMPAPLTQPVGDARWPSRQPTAVAATS